MYSILLSRVLLASLLSHISFTHASQPPSGVVEPVPNIIPGQTTDQDKISRFKNILENQVQQPTADIILDGEAEWEKLFKGPLKWGNLTNGYGGGEPLSVVCSAECRQCAQGCNPACCLVGGSVITVRPKPEDESNRRPNPPKNPSGPSRPAVPLPPGGGGPIPRPRPVPRLSCPCHCEDSCPSWVQAICCFTPDVTRQAESLFAADRLDSERVVAAADEHDPDSQAPLAPPEAVSPVPAPVPPPSLPRIPRPLPRIPPPLWKPESCPCRCEASCPAYVQAICCLTPGSLSRNLPVEDNLVDPAPPNPHTIPIIVQSGSNSSSPGMPLTVLAVANLTIFPSYVTMDIVKGLSRTSEITPNVAGDGAEIALTVLVGPDGQEKAFDQSFVVVDGSDLAEKEGVVLGLGFLGRVRALDIAPGWGGREEVVGVPLLTGTKVGPEGASGSGGQDGTVGGVESSDRIRDEL